MLYPRPLNNPATRVSTPNLFSTSTEIVCRIDKWFIPRGERWRQCTTTAVVNSRLSSIGGSSRVRPAAIYQNLLTGNRPAGVARKKQDHVGDFPRLDWIGNTLASFDESLCCR